MDIENNLQITILIIGLIGTLYKTITWIITWIKKQYEKLLSFQNKLDVIFKEVIPNGGGSIKDKINHLSEQMSINTQITEKIFHRQRWILDNREEPIFESSDDGKCIWVNSAYTKLFKHDISYFLEHGWKNVIHEEDRERVVDHWNDCVADGRMYQDTYRMVGDGGNIFLVECNAIKTHNNGYIGSLKIK